MFIRALSSNSLSFECSPSLLTQSMQFPSSVVGLLIAHKLNFSLL
jgi:hypothetical protein